ncbi:hypothetical protein TNCV_5057221 [Trichonephila clavipes]|nr:hypothetical protein TNCV_5057221 [Trichonephila clavipes]
MYATRQKKRLSTPSLNDSLSLRAVGRIEASQSQAKVARSLQVARKWSPGFRTSKQVLLLLEILTKIAPEHRYLHRIANWHESPDNIAEQRLFNLLMILELGFPGKQSTAVLQRLTFTPGVQSGASLWLYPEE